MEDKIYFYDGTFYGFLGLCGDLLASGEVPADIVSEAMENRQEGLFDNRLFFDTDMDKFSAAKELIISRMGQDSYNGITRAYLSEKQGIEMEIFRYIVFGMEKGRDADRFMSDDRFLPVYKAYRQVCMEEHRFKGFLRFEEIRPGIMYAKLEPEYNIIMMLASHFKRRLSGLNWIIHDVKRRTAVFYDKKSCRLSDAAFFELPPGMADEKIYKDMWKVYFTAMGIKERKNRRLQRQLAPKKLRKHMSEFSGGE